MCFLGYDNEREIRKRYLQPDTVLITSNEKRNNDLLKIISGTLFYLCFNIFSCYKSIV
jgi:hypothetical protein